MNWVSFTGSCNLETSFFVQIVLLLSILERRRHEYRGGIDMFSDDKWMDKVEDGWNEQGVRLMLDNLKGHGALARVALKANRAVLAHLDQNIEPHK